MAHSVQKSDYRWYLSLGPVFTWRQSCLLRHHLLVRSPLWQSFCGRGKKRCGWLGNVSRYAGMNINYLLTYCPSCHRQLGQQQILSISGGLEPVSVRFPMNDPLLSPLPQQYVSMSSLDARVFCVPLVSIRLLLLGWSLDLCVIYGLSISSVYVQL